MSSVPTQVPPQGKSDQVRLSKRDQRRRLALATENPILGARCARAQVRLFEFSVQVRDLEDELARLVLSAPATRARVRVDETGLQDAAEDVFSCVQQELAVRESPLDDATAFELANALFWERAALKHLLGAVAAKGREMYLSNSSPLTICMGSRKKSESVQTFSAQRGLLVAAITHYGSGCRRVFVDSTRTAGGGRMWRDWCPDCTPSKRKAGRDRGRAHRKVLELL